MSNPQVIPAPPAPEVDAFATGLVNLLQPRLGAEVTFVTDDFFAPAARMIDPAPPVFLVDEYDENGKWMDGWESRRRRDAGHDYLVLKLGAPATARKVDIDTSHFTGNYAPAAMLEGCFSAEAAPGDGADWKCLLPAAALKGNSHHLFELQDCGLITHLRLHIYPDGGIARLRLFGDIAFDWSSVANQEVDLAALAHGGRAIAWNNSHFGPPDSLLAPGRGVNMGDGWETRRRREPGFDWVILRLGHVGRIERALVDTAHFKGNFPESCALDAALVTDGTEDTLISRSIHWQPLLPRQKLSADSEHVFTELADLGPVSHVRLNIFPDGGVSRLRLFGKIAP